MRIKTAPELGGFYLDDGVLAPFREELRELGQKPPVRVVYAATRVVMSNDYAGVEHRSERSISGDEIEPYIDWETCLGQRSRLAGLGFGIAEAMDTAQRLHIGWKNAERLIRMTGAANLEHGFVAGAGADHLEGELAEDELVAGVVFQARLIQEAGGIPMLLPMIQLPERGSTDEDYVRVYGRIIGALEGPILVHWLGPMFHAALEGYFPGESFVRIMALDPGKVRGAKLSLLDSDLERRLRRDLSSRDQILFTGDDFHFGALMDGGVAERHAPLGNRSVPIGDFSHGLLGVFDAIAEPASCALGFLAHGQREAYLRIMEPCAALGRHLFQAPTQNYKAGLAFLAWLDGLQPNRMLPRHLENERDRAHYLESARLASLAGVLTDAQAAAERLRSL